MVLSSNGIIKDYNRNNLKKIIKWQTVDVSINK